MTDASSWGSFEVRDYRPEDFGFLWDMLYEAAFWRPDAPRPSRQELPSSPALAHYLEGLDRE